MLPPSKINRVALENLKKKKSIKRIKTTKVKLMAVCFARSACILQFLHRIEVSLIDFALFDFAFSFQGDSNCKKGLRKYPFRHTMKNH